MEHWPGGPETGTPDEVKPLLQLLAVAMILGAAGSVLGFELRDDGYHVFPGDDLQKVVNRAATNAEVKTVLVHEGVYVPQSHRQALVYLNRSHSGVRLIGIGRPTLSAANPQIADPASPSFPAVVNHVLYLGDGLSTNTEVRNFRLTGANQFVTNSFQDVMEPDRSLRKGRFYYGDGGAIKIYRRSYPVLRDLEVVDNNASPCAGGISIQHEGATNRYVLIENCIFRNNRAEVTGAALDLLWGSHARVVNCLFEGNVSNTGPGEGENPFDNNGVITVFPRSRLHLERCTLTGNRNGIDDLGGLSTYMACLLTGNRVPGGSPDLTRFELDLRLGGSVEGCVVVGPVLDPLSAISPSLNRLLTAPPRLDDRSVPLDPELAAVGYRPPTSLPGTGTR